MGKKLLPKRPAPASAKATDLLTAEVLLLHIQRYGQEGRSMDELRQHFDVSEAELTAELTALGKKLVQAFRSARNGHSPKVWRDARFGTR